MVEYRNYPAVYGIRCKENNKYYIGSTTRLNHRFNIHRAKFIAGKGINREIQQDYDKYGPDSFEYIELEKLPKGTKKDYLETREAYYCNKYDSYNNGYNIANPITRERVRQSRIKRKESTRAYRHRPILEIDLESGKILNKYQSTGEIYAKYPDIKKLLPKVLSYWANIDRINPNWEKSYRGRVFVDEKHYPGDIDYLNFKKIGVRKPRPKYKKLRNIRYIYGLDPLN